AHVPGNPSCALAARRSRRGAASGSRSRPRSHGCTAGGSPSRATSRDSGSWWSCPDSEAVRGTIFSRERRRRRDRLRRERVRGWAQELLPVALPEVLPVVLPEWQSLTNCERASPVSCLASACLLHALGEGCVTGVADGGAGGSAAAARRAPTTTAMAASTVRVFMPALLG